LDKTTLRGFGQTQVDRCVASVPESIWRALRVKAGSVAQYVAAKGEILNRLRRLITKQQTTTPGAFAESFASTKLLLVQLLEQAIGQRGCATQLAPVAERHNTLRAGQYESRVSRKAMAHLRVHELTASGATLAAGAMLRREHSKLYKH
jgi:hypothetical protein